MKTNEKIREIRIAFGLTQEEFARVIGCKQSTLSDYEIGRHKPSIKIAKSIIKAAHEKKIKVKLEDIFSDE